MRFCKEKEKLKSKEKLKKKTKEKEKGIKLELNRERKRGKERTSLIKREKKRDERDTRSAIVTHLNHILTTVVLTLFYLRVVRNDNIRKIQRWKKRERSWLRKRMSWRSSRKNWFRCGKDLRDLTGIEGKKSYQERIWRHEEGYVRR